MNESNESKYLALLLYGLSKSNYKHWSRNISKTQLHVDYRISYDNYQEYIFKYFENQGYTIDVYMCTNILDAEDEMEIVEKYKPIKYSFAKNMNKKKNIHLSRNYKLEEVIQLCLQTGKIYDHVLITRFDLLFQKDFAKSNIQLDKFNLVSRLENPNRICDNFYLFPYKYIHAFNRIVRQNKTTDFHSIEHEIERINGPEFINYILNQNCMVTDLEFYKIVRNTLVQSV